MTSHVFQPLAALLVDGDSVSRQSVAAVLAGIGYGRIWEASSMVQALPHLDQPWFDLAVVDLAVAEAEGYDLISLLGSRVEAVGRVVAIAETADEQLIHAALRRGASAVLPKPIDRVALASAGLVERRRAPRAA